MLLEERDWYRVMTESQEFRNEIIGTIKKQIEFQTSMDNNIKALLNSNNLIYSLKSKSLEIKKEDPK